MASLYIMVKSKVGLGGVTSTIAGPKRIIESVSVPLAMELVMNAYDWPDTVSGTTAEIISPLMVGITLVVFKPLTKVT